MAKKKKNTHALKRKEEKGERTCCFTCKQTKRTSNTEKKKSCLLLYVNGLRAGKARALCTVADKSEKHTCEQAAVTQRHVSARPKEERWRKDGRKERLEKETDAVTTTHTHTGKNSKPSIYFVLRNLRADAAAGRKRTASPALWIEAQLTGNSSFPLGANFRTKAPPFFFLSPGRDYFNELGEVHVSTNKASKQKKKKERKKHVIFHFRIKANRAFSSSFS